MKKRVLSSCFQPERYLSNKIGFVQSTPQEKIIKILIYRVKSSGNQAEYTLRQTAACTKNQYPSIHEVISNDVYVDDCLSGEYWLDEARRVADDYELVVKKEGSGLKGFTFSQSDPPAALWNDDKSISVGGMVWYPKVDKLTPDISEMNFTRKKREKKPNSTGIPSQLTRRHCKVSKIYDRRGKITPITAGVQFDLHDLVTMKIQLDDVLRDSYRALWKWYKKSSTSCREQFYLMMHWIST